MATDQASVLGRGPAGLPAPPRAQRTAGRGDLGTRSRLPERDNRRARPRIRGDGEQDRERSAQGHQDVRSPPGQAPSVMSRLISVGPRGQRAGPAWNPARRPGPALLAIATAQFMVALDTTIVNVALPHIQRALGFSGSGLEWVVNAYAVTFGGALLVGGRAGDLLGRRRAFVAGLLLFSAASLAGGLANSQAWLLAARAVQGTGAAITAPAALALIATSFPEGGPRNRAVGVYSAANAVGGTIGLLAGGLLSTYASWPWVLYVNVPIGVAIALAAPLVLAEAPRQRGRFGLPSALAGAGGVAA